jgi:hypothetical protein
MQEDFAYISTHPSTHSPSSLTLPYDPTMLHAAFEKVIGLHPCYSHFINSLESIFVCVSLHPCYQGFVTSFKNTNLFVKFIGKVW